VQHLTRSRHWPRFSTPYVVVFCVFTDLRSEVVVRFVDIGGIIDHHHDWLSRDKHVRYIHDANKCTNNEAGKHGGIGTGEWTKV
jgi:hypothetical protein